MEMRHLHYFVALYQKANFTKAAEAIFISQSALSQQIMQLENELGVTLFTRNTKKTIPTEAAHRLYPYALETIQSFDSFIAQSHQLSQKNVCTLRIFFQNKLRITKLVDILNEFIFSHADVTVEIKDFILSSGEDVSPSNLLAEWDLLLIRGIYCNNFLTSPLYCCELITEIPYYLIVAKDHPLASKAFIEYSDLQGIKILSGQRGGIVDQKFRTNNIGIPEQNILPLFTDDYDILASMLRSGRCATISSESFARYFDLAYVPLVQTPSDSIYMVYPAAKQKDYVIICAKNFILSQSATLTIGCDEFNISRFC